uniref:Retinoic acid induced 14 n=1 Tax=Sander lucioperca TaxID=283035 RepID=A0A8D0DCW3_SANLU
MKSLKAKFRKTDVNEWNKNDERLLAAVEHGEVDKVASLLAKKGASAVKLDNEGKSALHVAAARGQTDCLSVILAHGADLSFTDTAGFNPLHLAAKNNHFECCKKLIQSKCPIDAVDSSGKAALHHAGKCLTVLELIDQKCFYPRLVCLDKDDGLTPLLLSAKHTHAEVCSTLLDCGAEINTCDNSGRTALMLASESNAISVVEVLVQRGADLSAVDSQGHDVVHYVKLLGNSEVKSALIAALHRQQVAGKSYAKSLSLSRSHTLSSGPSSPSVLTSAGTPGSNKSDTPKRFNYKEDELVRGTTLREEVEKLHEERNMLLETIEDLKQAVEQTVEHSFTASAALVSALQAKINTLTLENQQLASKLKKHPSLQGSEDLKDTSRPNSMASNSSFHSTQDEFDSLPQVEREDGSGGFSVRREEEEGEGGRGGSKEEIRLLRQALESVQVKLLETRKENRSLQAQLKPERGREREEVENVQKHTSSTLEHEVNQLRALLIQSGSEQEKAAERIRQLEGALSEVEAERRCVKEKEQKTAQIEELYNEAQEEIRMLQEALRGTVPVEAAAKDFEEMKAELNEVTAGLQRRLLELSHSYSETKSQLSAAQKQLAESSAASSPSSEQQQVQVLSSKVEELQALLAETEKKHLAAQEEISLLRQEAEAQAQGSVTLADHTQVMSSLGNAIKELESQSEALKEQLHQKILQVEALQNRLTAEKDVTPDGSVSRVEYETTREQLEGEVNRLTQLLQGALRKQDEMALEAADAWQKNRAEWEALQELVMSREKENQTLTTRLAESQDAVCQLKQLVENHVASEREKNKRIDDLSREVGKLKDALNSLSQLSYSSGSPSKRQQQSQQLETMQQQIKQLQYQLAESKKQHHEIVSVYRMHLLYAVQGQMDEDVQKALKQILMMCKMPSQAKEAC